MQTTSNILLVRPANFAFNDETAESNKFQNKLNAEAYLVRDAALREFAAAAEKLRAHGVRVEIFADSEFPAKPDAIFPNNWVSFHSDGRVILYPMHAQSRRPERRIDLIDELRSSFEISAIIDLSHFENEKLFLEGTGSVVFDHVSKIAYASLSPRTDKSVLFGLCDELGYEPVYFTSHGRDGFEIYHTNVMMCVAEEFSVICVESISDAVERETVAGRLRETGHQIIDITFSQMENFAGNMLALKNTEDEALVVMSSSALAVLTREQRDQIERFCEIVELPINTIETVGGGSARCMIAEIFSKPKV